MKGVINLQMHLIQDELCTDIYITFRKKIRTSPPHLIISIAATKRQTTKIGKIRHCK